MIEGFTFTVGGTTYQKRPGSTITFALIKDLSVSLYFDYDSLYFDYKEGGLESWEAKEGEEIVDTFDTAGDMSLITRDKLRFDIEYEWKRNVIGNAETPEALQRRAVLLEHFEPVPEDDHA